MPRRMCVKGLKWKKNWKEAVWHGSQGLLGLFLAWPLTNPGKSFTFLGLSFPSSSNNIIGICLPSASLQRQFSCQGLALPFWGHGTSNHGNFLSIKGAAAHSPACARLKWRTSLGKWQSSYLLGCCFQNPPHGNLQHFKATQDETTLTECEEQIMSGGKMTGAPPDFWKFSMNAWRWGRVKAILQMGEKGTISHADTWGH